MRAASRRANSRISSLIMELFVQPCGPLLYSPLPVRSFSISTKPIGKLPTAFVNPAERNFNWFSILFEKRQNKIINTSVQFLLK